MPDHVWAAEAGGNHRSIAGQHPTHYRRLFVGQRHAAFPVGHANKKRQNHSVTGAQFGEIHAADRRKPRIKPLSFERADAPANVGFEKSAGVDIGIAGNAEEQQLQRPRRIERQDVLGVPKEGDTAIRDFVSRTGEFGASQRVRQGIEIDESISMQPDARLRAKHTRYRLIDSREGKTAGVYSFL